MKGSVHLNAPSYLPALIGTASSGSSLLASLYGKSAAAQGATDPIAALEQARNGEARQIASIAADPGIQREIAQFTQAAATAETPAELLANSVALKVLLTASGLTGQAGDGTQALRTLLPGPARQSGMSGADAWPSAADGLKRLQNPGAIAAITSLYVEALWRAGLDRITPGLSRALDFQRRAATIVNADQVFADPTFREVITTVLGISGQIAFLTPAARQQAIATRIDLSRFEDPGFVDQFTRRYLLAVQPAANPHAGSTEPEAFPALSRSGAWG